MSLGGKARPTEQKAPRTPDASAPHAGGPDDARAQAGARIRSHVRQVLLQVGSGPSPEGN